ncbi:MAG: phosphotransferase [Polyangiaceae bacterium]|nr:phosphotransferase [Polyangiaceae bacterium]MBK8939699.1 phosphotransferase [Polyangiaceae bacterium]
MTAREPARRPVSPHDRALFEQLLQRIEAGAVELSSIEPLSADRAPGELKRMGYGAPMLVTYRAGAEVHRVVFRTQSPNWFGHDRRSDRACLAILAADTYHDQPRHVRVLDVGAIREDELVSLHDAGEFYVVTTYVDGALYAEDLKRIDHAEVASGLDVARAATLAKHLAEVHGGAPPSAAPAVYERAIRDLVGSGEGIFGIVDSYPADFHRRDLLRKIEELALEWRWRIGRSSAWRLRRTHGDYHPYNVLFREGADFTVLDASRGSAGDPADDLAAMSINLLFGGMRRPAAWPRGFRLLWDTFFGAYLDATGDHSALEHLPPFFAWRALVLASPVWYPTVPEHVREALLEATVGWLGAARIDPSAIEADVPMLVAQ